MNKRTSVDVSVDLGDLKPIAQREARKAHVSLNEFICNALDSHIRRERRHEGDSYVRHGGKHLMGKHTGYEVTGDGRYYPAPSWTQHFEQLFAERNAITNLVNAVIAQAQERLAQVEKQMVQARARLVEDLGLDPTKDWVYYGGEKGYLKEKEASSGGDEPEGE